MGLNVASEKDYSGAIRNLFPQGEYWEKQFSDPASDLNLFCRAKTKEIIYLRQRMIALFAESNFQTAVETIDDWEHVLLGYLNKQLPLDERREVLAERKNAIVNRALIAAIAQRHGLTLLDIIFPFKPSFFGFSSFGVSIFSRPVFYSVIYIITKFKDDELKGEATECIIKLQKYSLFGYTCFGTGQFQRFISFDDQTHSSSFFSGIEALKDFEKAVNAVLTASNIAYFQYKL
jgi:hypothetical protein